MRNDEDVRCEAVQRRRVAAEDLDAPLAVHAAGCARCQERDAVQGQVARALAEAGRRAEPLDRGYVARVTAGAEARLARRAGTGRWPALAGVAVACAALVVWLGVRERAPLATSVERAGASAAASLLLGDAGHDPRDDGVAEAALVEGLVRLSDVEAGLVLGADWDEIEAPLAAVEALSPAARAPLGSRRN